MGANHRETKEVRRLLQQIANTLPIVFYTVQETQEWSGADLLLTGIQKQTDGNPLDPEKTYFIPSPVDISSNHFRRLRKAYRHGGNSAVNDYVQKVNALQAKQQANN